MMAMVAPPHEEGAPLQNEAPTQTTAKRSTATVPDVDDLAAELRRVLATDRPDFERGWRQGYHRGFDAGWNVGYGRARIELDETWEALAKRVIATGTRLSADDLRRLREMPTGQAWERWRARHGGDYRGGPVDWETGRPLRVIQGGRRA